MRREAIRAHYKAQIARLDIVATTITDSGAVIDWVPPLDPNVRPPPLPALPQQALSDKWAQSELQAQPWNQGPPGTAPIVRFDVEAYLKRVGDNVPDDPDKVQYEVDSPASSGLRYYNLYSITANGTGNKAAYWGGSANIEVVNTPFVESQRLSLAQIAVSRGTASNGNTLNTIEVGKIETSGFNSGAPTFFTFFTFFTTNGYASRGPFVGGYNGNAAFVPYPGSTFPPGIGISPGSLYVFVIHSDGDNKWWVYANGQWVGHYTECHDGSAATACTSGAQYTFSTAGLRTRAARVSAYGEVSISTVDVPTSTDMGNGVKMGVKIGLLSVLPLNSQAGTLWGVTGVPFGTTQANGSVIGTQQATWCVFRSHLSACSDGT